MDSDRGLQEVVSRNVRVLMAVHGINHQKDLAARLDWGADKLTRTLNGSRRWALDDLPAIAEVFGVRPAAMLSDTAELVGAAGPARASSHGVTPRVTHEYRDRNDATVIPFPQARRLQERYLTRTGDTPATRHNTPLSNISEITVTSVTPAVGT